jgi:hypothetical protein
MDLTRWNDGPDAELEQLAGGDLEMLELGRRLRAARPEPRIDPEFQRRLRAQLMTAAETELRPRGLSRLLRPRASLFAYGAAGLGTAMIAAAALAYYAPHSDQVTVIASAPQIDGQPRVNPDQVITISFNQPMDRRSVERGLKFQPAVDYYPPTWHENELIITPKHNLQANSGYVVTIPKSAARDVKGDVATKDITITFGTSPVAPSNPAAPPAGPVPLVGHDAGGVADDSQLGFTLDGSLLGTAGLVPAPAASAGDTTPGAGGPATTPALVQALVRYGSEGAVRLGDPVTAVALSPAGHQLATLSPSGDGQHAVVAVSDINGSHRSILSSAADAGSPLVWGGDETRPVVLFRSGGQLTSVDLERNAHAVSALRLASGQAVQLAPGGRYAFAGPAPATTPGNSAPAVPPAPVAPNPPLLPGVRIGGQGDVAPGADPNAATDAGPFVTADAGRIVDLSPGAGTSAPPALTGLHAGDVPSFSADGHRVAWIDYSRAQQPAIAVAPLDGSGPVLHVNLSQQLPTGDSRTAPVLDFTGERLAYALTHADGSGQLRVLKVSDASLLATATVRQPSALVFSPDGTELGYLQRTATQTVAEVAPVPGAPAGLTSVPATAAAAIDQLVAAEVAVDKTTLARLVAPAVETVLLSNLPGGLSRGYVISAAPTSGSDVTAQIRLLRDPTNDHPTATFTDQRVVLSRAGGDAWVVSQSDIPRALHDEPTGPQVVRVETSHLLTLTTVLIKFDSDLDPGSVNDSVISLTGAPSGLATPKVRYDAASRTVTVSFLKLLQPVGLNVQVGLRDVNGQGLASAFTTQVTPGQ